MAWRAVRGFDRYEVSDTGVVRSWRNSHRGIRAEPRILKPYARPSGHLYVVLTGDGSAQTKRYVHRLVIEAFVGSAPAGMECAHNDGNPANNALCNLRWATHKQNGDDVRRHGTKAGERHPGAKLRNRDVREIRASAESARALADRYGVSTRAIQRSRRGDTFARIDAL